MSDKYSEYPQYEREPDGFEFGYDKGYEQGWQDAIDKIYRHIKTECNPYGNPTLNYEDGMKILEYLNRLKEQNK